MAKAKKETAPVATVDGQPVVPATAVPAAPAIPEAPAVPKDIINGVTRPKAGTATGNVWAHCDTESAKATAANGGKPTPGARADILKACKDAGINDATSQTQYGRWRKYHGLATTRAPAAPAAVVVPAATVEVPQVPEVPAA